jgi:hypothetical protein
MFDATCMFSAAVLCAALGFLELGPAADLYLIIALFLI